MKKAVVDVCGTMFDSNTTFDYIDFVFGIKKSGLHCLLNVCIVRYSLLALGKLIQVDLYRYLYIYLLRGVEYTELQMFSSMFYDRILSTRKIEEVCDLISYINKEYKIVLCSASLDVVVAEVARRFEIVEWHSSMLNIRDGKCLGTLAVDLLGNKAVLFDNVDWVLTDNMSDLELVRKSIKSTIVSKQKNVKFWEKNSICVDFVR